MTVIDDDFFHIGEPVLYRSKLRTQLGVFLAQQFYAFDGLLIGFGIDCLTPCTIKRVAIFDAHPCGEHPAGHARKAAARLEELGYPVLFYENTDGGHAAGANLRETARRLALEYTYLTRRLMDQPAAE